MTEQERKDLDECVIPPCDCGEKHEHEQVVHVVTNTMPNYRKPPAGAPK